MRDQLERFSEKTAEPYGSSLPASLHDCGVTCTSFYLNYACFRRVVKHQAHFWGVSKCINRLLAGKHTRNSLTCKCPQQTSGWYSILVTGESSVDPEIGGPGDLLPWVGTIHFSTYAACGAHCGGSEPPNLPLHDRLCFPQRSFSYRMHRLTGWNVLSTALRNGPTLTYRQSRGCPFRQNRVFGQIRSSRTLMYTH